MYADPDREAGARFGAHGEQAEVASAGREASTPYEDPPTMSYDMSFQGTFAYTSDRTLQSAIAAFEADECIDESVVSRKDLQVTNTEIRLNISASAPASWWDTTCGVITVLAEHASSGHVDCEYDGGDGEESIFRVRIHAGGEEEELDEDSPDV